MARKTKRLFTISLICLLGGAIMFGLFGCGEKSSNKDNKAAKYKIDYDGYMDWYGNAKEEYAAGEEVELYYGIYATDTNYYFYLDGEPLNYTFDDEKGIVINFTMPEHDVKLTCESVNSMTEVPVTEPEGAEIMLIDSYRSTVATVDGGGYDEVTLYSYSDDEVKLNVYRQERDTDETVEEYIVPHQAYDDCMAVIDRYGMKKWSELEDPVSIDGAMLVCKFRDGSGYIRVTSDAMPEDGKEAFTAVESVLRGYIKDEYRTAE